jgi:PhzF family phenazine biosynthesis protein
MLADAATVLAVQPDFVVMGDLKLGLVGAHPAGHPTQFELRAFAPSLGLAEDPVTGSLNAGVAMWLIGAGLAPPRYTASQGAALGRAGLVHLAQDGDTLWVGGEVCGVVSGIVTL